MTTITFQGRTFHCPHLDLIPRHTPDERGRLDENGGFVYPVLLYDDTTLDLTDCVLDGHGRLGSASRTGAGVEFKHLGEMTTDEAVRLAERIENDRRHETPEVIRRRREQRVQRVAELRAAGKSLRAIAGETGVSVRQVQRDIDASGVADATPERVTGQDGKTYAASREADGCGDESGVADATPDEPEPLDDTLPQPRIDAGHAKTRPHWMVPGGKPVDPDHPFADVLKKFTALSAALTAKLRELPEEHPVRQALVEVGQHPHRVPFLAFTSDIIDGLEVKRGTVRFVGLYALRSLVRKYGTAKRYTPGQAVKDFFEAVGEAGTAEGEE